MSRMQLSVNSLCTKSSVSDLHSIYGVVILCVPGGVGNGIIILNDRSSSAPLTFTFL